MLPHTRRSSSRQRSRGAALLETLSLLSFSFRWHIWRGRTLTPSWTRKRRDWRRCLLRRHLKRHHRTLTRLNLRLKRTNRWLATRPHGPPQNHTDDLHGQLQQSERTEKEERTQKDTGSSSAHGALCNSQRLLFILLNSRYQEIPKLSTLDLPKATVRRGTSPPGLGDS